jgi:hypothetical protein
LENPASALNLIFVQIKKSDIIYVIYLLTIFAKSSATPNEKAVKLLLSRAKNRPFSSFVLLEFKLVLPSENIHLSEDIKSLRVDDNTSELGKAGIFSDSRTELIMLWSFNRAMPL